MGNLSSQTPQCGCKSSRSIKLLLHHECWTSRSCRFIQAKQKEIYLQCRPKDNRVSSALMISTVNFVGKIVICNGKHGLFYFILFLILPLSALPLSSGSIFWYSHCQSHAVPSFLLMNNFCCIMFYSALTSNMHLSKDWSLSKCSVWCVPKSQGKYL